MRAVLYSVEKSRNQVSIIMTPPPFLARKITLKKPKTTMLAIFRSKWLLSLLCWSLLSRELRVICLYLMRSRLTWKCSSKWKKSKRQSLIAVKRYHINEFLDTLPLRFFVRLYWVGLSFVCPCSFGMEFPKKATDECSSIRWMLQQRSDMYCNVGNCPVGNVVAALVAACCRQN